MSVSFPGCSRPTVLLPRGIYVSVLFVLFFNLSVNLCVPLITQKVMSAFASNVHQRCFPGEGRIEYILGMIWIIIRTQDPHYDRVPWISQGSPQCRKCRLPDRMNSKKKKKKKIKFFNFFFSCVCGVPPFAFLRSLTDSD